MRRHRVSRRSLWHILVVGVDSRPARSLELSLRTALPQNDLVIVDHVQHLPGVGLDRYAAILIDANVEERDLHRLARAPDLAWRSRTVLDLDACRPERVWQHVRSGALPSIAVGSDAEKDRLQDELARLLFADPVLQHLAPVLANLCSEPQRVLVTAFLRCNSATMPHQVARALARAPRSLSRDCFTLGLSPPQVLVKTARIARGLTLTVLQQLTINAAARVAGYRYASSFRKATRNTFGLSVSALLGDWDDAGALEGRFRRVLFRREQL